MNIIRIDISSSLFILSGNTFDIINNKRLHLSFKRIGYSIDNENITIPFKEETQIKTLQEIQRLLNKFGFEQELTANTINELESFDREEKLFEKFSKKAMSIRNNEFNNNPDLVILFEEFKDK